MLACTHFQKSNHIFQRDLKFVLIEQITKKYDTIEELRLMLKEQKKKMDLKPSYTLSRWFKSRTKQCMIHSFVVIACLTLGIKTSTTGSSRTQ